MEPCIPGRVDVAAYLARIGADPSDPLDVLVHRHARVVPFETLSIHLGEAISVDPEVLFEKIVVRHRGGFCHELNGLFAELLGVLGYEVTLLGAQVAHDDGWTVPMSHMALRVVDDGRPVLVDVGFGRFPVGPVALDPLDTRTLRPAPYGDLDVHGPEGELGYRLDLRPRRRADFGPTCFWQATAPDSGFTRGPVCSIPVDDGRVTMSGRTLLVTASDGTRIEEELTDREALAAYRDRFGIELDRLPVPLYPGP